MASNTAAAAARGARTRGRTGPQRAASTADRSARVAAKVREAQDTLASEVEALCSGEDWKAYLALQARLHAYSPNNVMLIALQHARAHRAGLVPNPEPGLVAGFHTWRSLGRSVEKGQHGYVVLAPCRYDRRVATDGAGTERRLGASEQPGANERVEHRQVLAGFRVEHVFELTQTSGVPIPEPPRPKLLEGGAPAGLWEAMARLLEARGFAVALVAGPEEIGGANGQTSFSEHTVAVRADMDEAARVKTLLHEAGHVLLHEAPPGRQLPRPLKEVEAESVAFVVAAAHGMATDAYSFPYVSAWAGGDGAKAVQATQVRVATAARELIEASPVEHLLGGKAATLQQAATKETGPELRGGALRDVSEPGLRVTPDPWPSAGQPSARVEQVGL